MKYLSTVVVLFLCLTATAQNVGVGTTTPSAKLDISSTNSGVLIPRLALTATNVASPVTSPVASMLIYNTANAGSGATAVTPGYYYWSGSAWVRLIDNAAAGNNIYNTDGTLTGARTVTDGANNLTFTSSTGNLNFTTTSGVNQTTGGNMAMGNSVTASGGTSVAFGTSNTASGVASLVTGWQNNATGPLSVAFGQQNTASGYAGFAVNLANAASGGYSSAFGKNNTASGDASSAGGFNNHAYSFAELAVGINGTTYTPSSTTAYSATDRIFNVGNGSASGSLSDALTVLKNGNVGIGVSAPGASLDLANSTGYNLLTMQSAAAAGTWLSLGNNSTGGKWFDIINTGSGNSEGVAKLIFDKGVSSNGTAAYSFLTMDWNTGNVGIGNNTAPTQKLDVTGTTKTTNLQMTSGATANYIMQSDASGNASWVNPSTITTATSVSNNSSTNTLTTTVNGVTGTGVNIINSNTSTWTQAGGLTNTVNGVTSTLTPASGTIANVLGYSAAGAPVYQALAAVTHSVSNTISGNTISTTVDATTGAAVTIPNIYTANGTLTAARTVTQAGNSLTFTGGNVGIGTAPNDKFDVLSTGGKDVLLGGGAATGSELKLTNSGNAHMSLYNSNGNLTIANTSSLLATNTAGTALMTVTSTGNVGIGATAPVVPLAVGGNGTSVYSTSIWAENNIHVQGNETMTQGGGRGRLRVGTAWNFVGLYSEAASNGTANDLVLGASSSLIRVGPDGGGQNLKVSGLEGTGNRPVYANSNGQLKVSNGDNSSWVMSSNMASSQDDLAGTVLSADGDDDVTYHVTLPFAVTIEGVSYGFLAVCTNGWASFETASGQVTTTAYSETSLPSSTFNNPTVFAYWDDLKDYGSGEAIRSQTFGSSPNRTHVIDWKLRALSGTVYNVFFQMEIHEGSNMINVKYHSMDAAYCGQSATIGFQLAGGSSAKAFPITYDGKVLDDNAAKAEGWSVCPLR